MLVRLAEVGRQICSPLLRVCFPIGGRNRRNSGRNRRNVYFENGRLDFGLDRKLCSNFHHRDLVALGLIHLISTKIRTCKN